MLQYRAERGEIRHRIVVLPGQRRGGFPDFMSSTNEMLRTGVQGVKMAGFYGHDWTLQVPDRVLAEQ